MEVRSQDTEIFEEKAKARCSTITTGEKKRGATSQYIVIKGDPLGGGKIREALMGDKRCVEYWEPISLGGGDFLVYDRYNGRTQGRLLQGTLLEEKTDWSHKLTFWGAQGERTTYGGGGSDEGSSYFQVKITTREKKRKLGGCFACLS